MAKTFLDELTEIQGDNFLGGVVKSAAANLMEQRTKTTTDILANLNQGLLALDSAEPQSSATQLRNLGQDPNAQKELSNLTDIAANYQAFSQNITARQQEYSDLYDSALTNLAVTGGEEAGRVSEVLSKRKTEKVELLQKQIQNFQDTLKTEKTLYDIEAARYDIEKTKLDIDKFKSDKDVMDLTAKMITFTDPSSAKIDYNNLFTKMNFNAISGRTSWTGKDLDNLQNKLWEIYGKDSKDSTVFSKAWMIIETKLKEAIREYRPHAPQGNIGGNGSLYGDFAQILAQMRFLKETTKLYGQRTRGNESWVKEAYMVQAEALGIKGDPFSNTEVISSMQGDAKAKAQEVHDYFYNNLNEDYYWNGVTKLKAMLSPTHQAKDYTIELNPKSDKGKMNLPGGMSFTWSDVMLNEKADGGGTGWWNPNEPDSYVQYDKLVEEFSKKYQEKSKHETELKNISSNLKKYK